MTCESRQSTFQTRGMRRLRRLMAHGHLVQETPATLPDQVVLNTGDDLEPGFSSVTVRWDAPGNGGSDITHYLVRYALSTPGSQFSSDIRVNAPATRTTIRGLRTDSGYVVQVQAVNAIGKGTSSAETGFSTSGVASAPASVIGSSNRDDSCLCRRYHCWLS